MSYSDLSPVISHPSPDSFQMIVFRRTKLVKASEPIEPNFQVLTYALQRPLYWGCIAAFFSKPSWRPTISQAACQPFPNATTDLLPGVIICVKKKPFHRSVAVKFTPDKFTTDLPRTTNQYHNQKLKNNSWYYSPSHIHNSSELSESSSRGPVNSNMKPSKLKHEFLSPPGTLLTQCSSLTQCSVLLTQCSSLTQKLTLLS